MKSHLLWATAWGLLLFMLLSCGTPKAKIGYVNPTTGALAGSGEGYDWVIDQMYDYLRKNPLYIRGKAAETEIIVYDCQSDPELCRKFAERLIKVEKVDILLALQTIGMVIPETAVAEEHGTPCVSIEAPTDALAAARESYNWTYHAFWTVDKIYETYRGLWAASGHGIGSGAKVGFLFPDDPDGNLWGDIFARRAREEGYVVVDPGRYPLDATDFSAAAALFRREGVDVLTGTNLPATFIAAMNALNARGVQVDCITMGRACMTQMDTEALGDKGLNLGSACWWNKNYGFVSDLTGLSSQDFAAAYAADNFDAQVPQTAAYAYAGLEIALQALKKAGSTKREKVRAALASLDINTIVGPIRYDKVCGGLHYSETVIGGGQWQFDNNELIMRVVDNAAYPQLPLDGSFRQGNVTRPEGLQAAK